MYIVIISFTRLSFVLVCSSLKCTNDFNQGSMREAFFINSQISLSWYLVCKSLATALFAHAITGELSSSSKFFRILSSTGPRTDKVGYLLALR